jgi:general stress protein YciG
MRNNNKIVDYQIIDVQAAGRLGGQSTLRNHGKNFYKTIGSKGGRATSKKYKKMLAWWGQLGGRPNSPKIEELLDDEEKGGEAVGPLNNR